MLPKYPINFLRISSFAIIGCSETERALGWLAGRLIILPMFFQLPHWMASLNSSVIFWNEEEIMPRSILLISSGAVGDRLLFWQSTISPQNYFQHDPSESRLLTHSTNLLYVVLNEYNLFLLFLSRFKSQDSFMSANNAQSFNSTVNSRVSISFLRKEWPFTSCT